jgi:tetratricopeptide (TPR) repeat protein
VPAVIFIIALWSHLVTLFITPSLLYLIYTVKLRHYPFFNKIWVWIVGIAALTVAAYPLIIKYVVPEIYPCTMPFGDEITLFSPMHFYEYANGIVLGTGFLIIVTVFCLLYAWYYRIRMNRELLFLLVTSASMLLCLFILRPLLGSADWDIFSYAALSLNLLGVYLLLYMFKDSRYRPFLSYVVVVTTVLMAIETFAWIGINARQVSIKRFADIILTDHEYYYQKHPAPLHIACILSSNNLHGEAIPYYKMAFERYPDDSRCVYNYAIVLYMNHDVEKAYTLLRDLLHKSPDYALPYKLFLDIAISTNRTSDAVMGVQQLFEMYSYNPSIVTTYLNNKTIAGYFSFLGYWYCSNHKLSQAEDVYEAAVYFAPDNKNIAVQYAGLLFVEKKFDRAIEVCSSILRLYPNAWYIYQLKAESLVNLGLSGLAAECLNQGIFAVSDNYGKQELYACFDKYSLKK